MALAVIGEAGVGALAGELLRAVLELHRRVTCFKDILQRLETARNVSETLLTVRGIPLAPDRCADVTMEVKEDRFRRVIRIKVDFHCSKCRTKAMKIACTCIGVESVEVQTADRSELLVRGECDTVALLKLLRRRLRYVTLLSVEDGTISGLTSTSAITPSSSPSSSQLAALKSHDNLCHCGRRAALMMNPDAEGNVRPFYYCENHNCGYIENYVPAKNETSAVGELVSNDDSNNSDHGFKLGELATDEDFNNSDNREKENDEIEETPRKYGYLAQRLHAVQGTVNGLKLLTVTS